MYPVTDRRRSPLAALAMALGLSALLPSDALAQQSDPRAALPPQAQNLLDGDPQRFLELLVQRLYELSPDGTVTRADLQRQERIANARLRADLLAQLLPLDLDGDGTIAAEEVAQVLQNSAPKERARLGVMVLEADGNGDGSVTFAEMVANAEAKLRGRPPRQGGIHGVDPLLFDRNGDGSVTVQEVVDWVANPPAADPISGNPFERLQQREERSCELPPPDGDAEIVLVSAYNGAGLSSVSVAGQDDSTTTAWLTVEPGPRPLYVFATASDNMIWQIEGAVERIRQFVAQPTRDRDGPGVGVTGLDPTQVSFAEAHACAQAFSDPASDRALAAKARLAVALGQPVDRVLAVYELGRLALPSGTAGTETTTADETGGDEAKSSPTLVINGRSYVMTENGLKPVSEIVASDVPEGVDPDLWHDFGLYHPLGVLQIEASEVVAPGEVSAYEVLPQEAGLIQLMQAGLLRRIAGGAYLIEKPIPRFPASLAGGHSVRFILGRGVPMPAGDPGHSGVRSQETGECLVPDPVPGLC